MSTARKITYKCMYCDERYTRQDLVNHVEENHEDEIPEGFTAFRLVFNYVNKKPLSYHGKCTECGKSTPWDENKGRYDRQCGSKACHDSYVRKFEENMIRRKGVKRISSTEEGQKKMLANRRISGVYKFRDGGEKSYCGSYELKALEFMDKVLEIKSADIMAPGPVLEYEFEGKTHMYITDFYYQPYNLIIEVKDGGDNPNRRNMPEYRKKQIEKEKFIIKNTNYNYLRLTNNDLKQLMSTFVMLKLQMVENTGERVIHVNESVVPNTPKESDIGSVYFVYSKNGAANCCVKIKGYKYPCRARSTMIPLRYKDGSLEIFSKKRTEKDWEEFKYTFPGGGWDPNEDPQEAAEREAQEECRINIKDSKFCGDMLEYDPDKVAKWVQDNVEKDQWWYGYYTKIYVGFYKSEYKGKIEDVDQDPVMMSGKWYKYEDIKNDLHEKYIEAIESYIKESTKEKTTPLNEYMNALMSGKVVGLNDSDAYIVNYLPKQTFSGEKGEYDDPSKRKRKIAVSNGTFSKVLYRKENGILSRADFPDVINLENASIYKLDMNTHQVSEILSSYLDKKVSENFIYESLTGKKLYTFDQIPFTLECIDNQIVNIPELVKDSIFEDKIGNIIKETREAIKNG